MANNMTFSIGLKTNYDASGVNQLKKELQDIQKLAKDTNFSEGSTARELVDMTNAARELEKALEAAYDPQIGTVNIDRFNKSLQASGTSLAQVQSGLKHAGAQGEKAFLGASRHLLQMNKVIKESNTLLDKMATTMANTVRWGITSALWNNITGSIQTAFYYIKDLDTALNDIRIVTGKSAEDMADFAVEANNAAKALAVTTEDYTRGALIYYQQGLDDETVRTLTDITSMTANVTGQSMDTVSEQLTAVWNGYKVANQAAEEGIGVYEEYVDKMAAVGAATASDLEEISTAMSKVASGASTMGISFDSLTAQIATIVSVTREAPESVGTALKTIYARMGDLKLGKTDEDGVDLGQVSGELDKLGIAVLDAQGNMRDMEEVITEVGEAWDSWTRAEQQAIAVALAGKRQYNNLLSLFNNWTMYTDTLNVSLESAGTLQEQQAIATESLANKMDVLRATAEDLYDNLFNEEAMKDMVDGATKLLQVLANVVDSIGGLQTILPMIGAIGLRVFSTQIGNGLVGMVNSLTATSRQTKIVENNFAELKEKYNDIAKNMDPISVEAWEKMKKLQEERLNLAKYLTEEEQKQYDIAMERIEKNAIAQMEARDAKSGAMPSFITDNLDMTNAEDIAKAKENAISWNQLSQAFGKIDISAGQDVSEILNSTLKQVAEDQGFFEEENVEEFIKTFSEKYSKILSEFEGKLLEDLGENGEKIVEKDAEKIIEAFRQELQESAEDSLNYVDIMDNANQAQMAEEFAQAEIETIQLNTALEETTAIISDAIGSVTSLATGFSMLGQLSNIWKDDNLTGWEKFSQTISNLIIALPMIVTGILGIKAAFSAETIAKVANTAATILNTAAEALNAKTKRDSAVASGELTGATTGESVAKLSNAFSSLASSSLGKVKEAFATLFSSIKKFIPVLGKFLLTLGKGLASFAMANPILAVLAVTLGTVVIAYNAYIKKMEETRKAFQESSKAFQETTSNLQNLESQLTGVKERLEELYAISKDDLTITNKEEIANLEKENALLQSKIEMEKALLEIQEAQAIQDFKDAVEAGNYNTNVYTGEEGDYGDLSQFALFGVGDMGEGALFEELDKEVFGVNSAGEALQSYSEIGIVELDKYEKYLDAVEKAKSELEVKLKRAALVGNEEQEEQYQRMIDNLTDWEKAATSAWNESRTKALTNISEEAAEIRAILPSLYTAFDQGKLTEEEIKKAEEVIKNEMLLLGTLDDNVQKIIDISFDEKDGQGFVDKIKSNIDVLINPETGVLDEAALQNIIGNANFADLEENARLFGISLKDVVYYINEYGLNYKYATESSNKSLQDFLAKNKELKDYLLQLADTKFLNEESLALLPEYDELLELVGGEVENLIEALEELEDQSITTFDSLNDLSNIQSGFDSLATVYQQKLSEGGMVDLESLTGLYNDFGDVEGFNDFIAVMQDMDATSEEVQIAFNNLATSYVKQKFGLLEITEANKDYVAAVMTTMGITNAQEVVNWQLTKSGEMYTEALADIQEATSQTAMTSEELQNATTEELEALYEEAIAAGYDAESLRVLLIAKQDINLAELDTADDVEALLAIGGAAVLSGKQLEYLLQLEAQLAELDYNYQVGNIKDSGAYQAQRDNIFSKYNEGLESAKDDYRKTVEDMMAEVEVGMPEINFDGTSIDKDSGSSSRSTKDQKDFDDEYDRYWEFNKLIEKVTDTIEDLDEAQENLHGRELISALENENRLLDKQAEAYEKLYAEQKREQAELQSSLGSLGLQFDADGAITNYAAQTSQMLSDYNKAVAEYNAGMMNEETFAIYEQNYEKFKTGLARYEELYYSEMKDAQDKLEEIRKQQRANNLEAWEIDIELKLETSEFERDVANFLHDIEDDFKKVYEDLGDDFENIFANMGTYDADVSTTLQAIKDVTAEIDKMQNGEESDMFESISQAQEKLKDLNKDLQDSASSMHDLWVDAWDTYMEGIDQSADKLEDLNEKYERIGQEIEFQGDLIKLLYGDEAYDLMADYFDTQKTNTLAQVDSFRQQRDMWKQMYESAEEGSEDQQKYYELMNEAQDNLNGSVKEYIELLQNEATNAIDGALKKYENLITNGQGLDVVNEQWERTKDYADAVFDSVEKTYHVQDLASKIKQSINDAEGLKSQQKLQELYDKEINYLLDKKELTQYDIDAANARYQIALKEIALEEAQNAKNSMKVVRGADGNWDYQYVADDENAEEKKRELSDSIYALYELANNSYMESMDNLLEIEQKYQEQAKALAEEAVQTGADVSERKRALDEWYESEKTRISEQGALARQDMLTSSVGVLKDAYDNNVINYENMTNSQIALIEGVSQAGVDSFADLEVKVNDNFQNIGDMAHQVIAETIPEWNSAAWDIAEQWIGDDGSIKQAFEETGATLTQITEDYRTDVDELGEVADMNLGEDGIAGALQDNIELTEELEGATENLVDTSVDALEEYQDALSAVENAWYAVKDSITSAIDEIREYLALAGQASNVDVSMSNPTAGRGNSWDFGTGDGGNGSGQGNLGDNKGESNLPGPYDWVTKYRPSQTDDNSWIIGIDTSGDKKVDLTTSYAAAKKKYKLNKENVTLSFDTGGYTGEWGGGEGRMAMLHSKELVLNAKDTENILDAVSAVRSFASIGNSINEAIMSGIAKMLLSASGKVLRSVSKVDNSSNDNSQNIFHINAEFPNANDMAEIQAAILSLPRIASQQTEIIVK